MAKVEAYLFNDLIESSTFESWSTSTKIEWCLRKDIFFLGKSWTRDPKVFKSADFNALNFSPLDSQEFDLNGEYKINDNSIWLNPLFEEEIFTEIEHSIGATAPKDEINFFLNTMNKPQDKLDYLRQKINENNPFELKNLMAQHWYWSKRLDIHHDTKIMILQTSSRLMMDWIYGIWGPGGTFPTYNYPELEKFVTDFQKFSVAQYCFNTISSLLEEAEDSSIDEFKNFRCLAAVHFFDKMGIIRKLQKAGYTNTKIHSILGKLTSNHPKTIEKSLKDLLNLSELSERRVKNLREVDEIISNLTNL